MRLVALSLTLALAFSGARAAKDKRPKISVKASPAMAISPARVVASADITGGADDYEEFYCPAIEWDWGDDTRSTPAADCVPSPQSHSIDGHAPGALGAPLDAYLATAISTHHERTVMSAALEKGRGGARGVW